MSEDKKIEIITNISELNEFVDSDDTTRCLVVLDMDDVIIRGVQSVGSDVWFHQSLKDGRGITEVLDNMGMAYSLIDYVHVEKDTSQVLTKLLSYENVDYLIMTSRGMSHYSQTVKHLREAGKELADLLIRPNMLKFDGADDLEVDGIQIDPEDPEMYPRLRQVRYIDNICFCSGNRKDLVLEEIVHRVHTAHPKAKYKKIIFFDDSIQNVNRVHTSFIKPRRRNLYRTIETYAVHYSLMEIHKRKYDTDSLKRDDEKMRLIKNCISHINGRVGMNYVVTFNVFMAISLLWWFVFRFLGIIGC
jgi:Protein of unknown function (DUF2608)